MHSPFTLLLLLFSVLIHSSETADWDYHKLGPDVWKDLVRACNGKAQSPIDIKTECTVYQNLPPFNYSSYYNLNHGLVLLNNGHGISATLINQTANPPRLTGGGLNGTYEFVNFHLHWGQNYASGSEHEVNGEKFAAEIHFVHAKVDTNALAVLGFFVKTRHNSSSHGGSSRRRKRQDSTGSTPAATEAEWVKYFNSASNLTTKGSNSTTELNLALLMGKIQTDFWRYAGSLTTPSCSEGVTWTVFTEPIELDDELFDVFRDDIFSLNFREPQPLNNRTVYRSFLVNKNPSGVDSSCCLRSLDNRSNSLSVSLLSSFILMFLLLIHLRFY